MKIQILDIRDRDSSSQVHAPNHCTSCCDPNKVGPLDPCSGSALQILGLREISIAMC